MPEFLHLAFLKPLTPIAWLALRLYVGWFLIVGVWDNVTFAERMTEFEGFLRNLNCPMPEIAAPTSVYTQLLIGALLIPGLLARFAGLLLAVNFIVAVVLLAGAGGSERDLFPPAILVFVGFALAAQGAGALSLDRVLSKKA